jgi:ribosomal protein S2
MLYTIKQFIKYGVHLGHYKWECDYRLSYYLLGVRNSIHILNLYYTLFILKQALYITYNVCLLNQKLLIANNVNYKLKSIFEDINKIINQNQLWYINNKWIGGLLSNQRDIFLNNEKLFLNFYGLGYSSLLPSYVFASNIKETSSCIFESIILNIPSSSLLDSNIGFYGIFYGLPSNDDNYVNIYMFSRLFIKICLKSIYDNINILKIEEEMKVASKLEFINDISLDFIYNRMLDNMNLFSYKQNNLNEGLKEHYYPWMKYLELKKNFEKNILVLWKKNIKQKKKKKINYLKNKKIKK